MPLQLRVLQEGRHDKRLLKPNLRVGALAKQAGKTVRAIHLYEELGLLEPAERTPGGYRLYDAESVTRVRWIAKLQEMGFSLSDIQTLAEQWASSESAPRAMSRVQSMMQEKLAETRQQIERLRQLEDELQASLDYLETCPSCDPKQLLDACTACTLHAPDEHEPELVAGFHAY